MRIFPMVLSLFLLAACAHAPQRDPPPRNPLAEWVPSPNFEARRPVIIVVHATEQGSAQESLDTLRTANSKGPVSSHYLVGDDGRIYQLVADGDRAWHAGGGSWGTITDLNTGLQWEAKNNDGSIHDKDATHTWDDAFAVHVAGLNAASFAGHNDWRLPNVRELQSLLVYDGSAPSVDAVFSSACPLGCAVTTCSCTVPNFCR